MQVTPSDVKYSPLPTNEWLPFLISDEKEQPNFFDKTKKVLIVEFSITASGLDKRKVWRNFGPFWPKQTSDKTTQFFELVKAVDPVNAIRGKTYDSKNLRGKTGRLMVVDYESKEVEPPTIFEDEVEVPNPKAGQKIIKQKVDRIAALPAGSIADITPAQVEESLASNGTKKVKF